jgi:RNA polymerase sigma factor (sigma-70 family)
MQDDVLLVQQALSGDKLAFCRLIQKYYKSIYAQILSLVHNPEDTEELTDDVFIKAYVNLSDLRQSANFHKWLRQIAWNHSRNWLRQRENNCLPLDDVYDETEAVFICDSVEDRLIHQEKLDRILGAIDTLPEMDKSLMQDFYLEETPYETLQERYKITKPAINARLIRARKRIREQLKDLFSGIVIFSWHDVLKKMLSGGVEAVKISVKTKLIVVGIAVIIVSGGTSLWMWHSHQSTQETPERIVQIPQKVASAPNVAFVSNNKSINIDNKTIDRQSKDAQEKVQVDIFPNSPKESLPTETKPKEESPAELLDMYMNLNKSPEFQAELQKVFRYSESESQPIQEKFMNLEMREKELERDLENASEENRSKIQDDLAKAKADLWEADVELSEKSILTGDAIWQLYLRYFTKEQLQAISAEKERRQQSPFSISEKVAKSLAEAKERLKAKGWVSSNPNDR